MISRDFSLLHGQEKSETVEIGKPYPDSSVFNALNTITNHFQNPTL